MNIALMAKTRPDDSPVTSIPKIIWCYWEQGLIAAPDVVHLCVRSWRLTNPNYDLRVLSGNSPLVKEFGSRFPQWSRWPVQKRANLLRLWLLDTWGGVWVDATLYCREPLDEWLPGHERDGAVFVQNFESRSDRIVDNFFIASLPGQKLVTRWFDETHDFFSRHLNHRASDLFERPLRKLGKALAKSPLTDRFWISPINRLLTRLYPYFIHHYLLTSLIRHHEDIARTWHDVGKLQLGTWPLTFNQVNWSQPEEEVLRHISQIYDQGGPFYKFSHRPGKPVVEHFNLVGSYLDQKLSSYA